MILDCVMTHCDGKGVTFLNVKCSNVCDMYYGRTEKFVELLFAKAKEWAPCLVTFDEVDSLFSTRSGNDSSATQRMKSMFLTEIKNRFSGVVIVGTTNFPGKHKIKSDKTN